MDGLPAAADAALPTVIARSSSKFTPLADRPKARVEPDATLRLLRQNILFVMDGSKHSAHA